MSPLQHSTVSPPVRVAAPLRQEVLDTIRQRIVGQQYSPGSRLVERVLCENFKVSRNVVREAIRQLESEHLIEMVPNVGSVVRRLDPLEVRSLYAVRASLEALAARDCARQASDELIERLRVQIKRISVTTPLTVSERMSLQNEFMAIIVEGSGNVVVGEMLGAIASRVSRLRVLTLQEGGNRRQAPGLRRVFQAIRDRDPDAADRAVHEYVGQASEIALRLDREPLPG